MTALRPYQRHATTAIRNQFSAHRSTLLVLATGLGKTVVFSHLAANWETGRVLVLAHREELVEQARQKLAAMCGGSVTVEMAGESARAGARVVVASKDSIRQPRRLERFDPEDFGLIITDEAHHAVADSYGVIYKHFQQNANCKHLGVTATPKRHDEFAMEQVFESVAYNYGIEEAVIDGWLVPVRQHVVKVEDLDFSSIRTTAGDFNERDLEAVMLQEKVLHAIASPAVELCGDRPTLVFCVTVAHAERITEILNRYKKGSAEWLCGETPKDERRAKVQDFKDGKTQYLCNCGLFLEGFDAPNTANIVMGRPTKSLPLYTQVIGRGTRALPGVIDPFAEGTPEQRKAAILASGKPFMTIFDFAGNAGRHKLISAADILGGKWGVPVRERAKKVAEEEGESGMMVDDALEAASDELELLKEQQEIRRRAEIKAKATYQSYNVNAFDKSDSHSSHTQSTVGKEPPTEKQIWKLKSLGVKESTARGYSKKQASAVISTLMEKQNGG